MISLRTIVGERVSEDHEVLEWIIRARGSEGDSEDTLDCKGAADEGGDNHSLSRYSDFLLGGKTVVLTRAIESLGFI
jgi:hypothetical protein